MEVIILAIITMIISAFSKKKNAGDDGKSKPFMSKPLDQPSMKKIEDYAKEVYGDVRKQVSERSQRMQPKPELKNQVKQVQETLIPSRERVPVKEVQQATKRPGRLSAHKSTSVRPSKSIEKTSLVPSTKKELVQAIIFSEILAPPKSKR